MSVREASLSGFEPLTYRLEICCTIQLCYRDRQLPLYSSGSGSSHRSGALLVLAASLASTIVAVHGQRLDVCVDLRNQVITATSATNVRSRNPRRHGNVLRIALEQTQQFLAAHGALVKNRDLVAVVLNPLNESNLTGSVRRQHDVGVVGVHCVSQSRYSKNFVFDF